MEGVLHRGLHRLVVLGEGPVVEDRGIEPAHALRQHDEGTELTGRAVGLDVRDVPTHFSPFHWMPARFGSQGLP
jgi:hypothetical protein